MMRMLAAFALTVAAPTDAPAASPAIEIVAELPQRPTGIAVASDGRVFVSLPFADYADPAKFIGALVVLGRGGVLQPFPNAGWNTNPETATAPADRRFVNVQGHTIAGGTLWALDRGRPRGKPVVAGGAKLVGIDLARGEVRRVIAFDAAFARDNFLNDVRVDPASGTAYVTNTGNGGVIVVDLATGR